MSNEQNRLVLDGTDQEAIVQCTYTYKGTRTKKLQWNQTVFRLHLALGYNGTRQFLDGTKHEDIMNQTDLRRH